MVFDSRITGSKKIINNNIAGLMPASFLSFPRKRESSSYLALLSLKFYLKALIVQIMDSRLRENCGGQRFVFVAIV